MVLGAYYAKARMYDAENRRFMAVDPVKGTVADPQTMAQYTYCLDNPVIFVDMLGLEALYINGKKVANPWGDSTGEYYGGMTNLLEQMASLRLISLGTNWKSWDEQSKTAQYNVFVGNQNVKFTFNTNTGKGSVEAGERLGWNLFIRTYFDHFTCDDFLLNSSSNRVEVNLAMIKRIFDELGVKFNSWEIKAQFVGYLSYGATGITSDPNKGYYRLYDAPTLTSQSTVYNFADLYKNYGENPTSALQAYGGTGMPNNHGGTTYGGQTYDPEKGTLTYNGIKRHGIALGPALQNPAFTLNNGKINPNEMAYGTCVDVAIQLGGNTYYIPAIIVDVKAHTAPTGVFQTDQNFAGSGSYNYDGNIVEWYTKQYTSNNDNKSLGLNQFSSTGSIAIYRNEVLK